MKEGETMILTRHRFVKVAYSFSNSDTTREGIAKVGTGGRILFVLNSTGKKEYRPKDIILLDDEMVLTTAKIRRPKVVKPISLSTINWKKVYREYAAKYRGIHFQYTGRTRLALERMVNKNRTDKTKIPWTQIWVLIDSWQGDNWYPKREGSTAFLTKVSKLVEAALSPKLEKKARQLANIEQLNKDMGSSLL